jgi:mannose-6-phosphate isomerase-like protein (cupin superfamily)
MPDDTSPKLGQKLGQPAADGSTETHPKTFKRMPVAKDEAQWFNMRVPLLDQGRMDTEIARAAGMTARIKVYASGGENELHCHASQDHMFVILQGSARFTDKDGGTHDVAKHEGVMLPAGVYYWFEATSEEPLVMLRVDNAQKPGDDRLNIDGKPMPGNSIENKTVPVIIREGAFFE